MKVPFFSIGQSILAKLASSEENKDILSDLLSHDIYKRLIETLYLPDISVSKIVCNLFLVQSMRSLFPSLKLGLSFNFRLHFESKKLFFFMFLAVASCSGHTVLPFWTFPTNC